MKIFRNYLFPKKISIYPLKFPNDLFSLVIFPNKSHISTPIFAKFIHFLPVASLPIGHWGMHVTPSTF